MRWPWSKVDSTEAHFSEDQFWSVIDSNQGNAEAITTALKKLSAREIDAWDRFYWDKHNSLHRWDVWGAAYVMKGGCGDDSFHYFKSWLIGKGRKAYETGLANPDDIGPFAVAEDEEEGFDNELLNYASSEAYEGKTRKELEHRSCEGSEPAGDPWEEDEEVLARLFPKLWARFG